MRLKLHITTHFLRYKTFLQHYGFVCVVLLYVAALIILDCFGFFSARTKLIGPYVNKVCELKATVVSKPDEKSNRIEFVAEALLSEITPAYYIHSSDYSAIHPATAFVSRPYVQGRGRNGKVKLLAKCYDIESDISLYDVIEVRGKILPLPCPRNPGQFDYGKHLLRKGVCGILIIDDYTIDPDSQRVVANLFTRLLRKIHIYINRFVFAVRQKMITAIRENLPTKEASILIAIFAGEKSELLPEIRSWFVDSGVMHTLVVSGLHVGYVVAVFWFLLRFLPVGSVWLPVVTIGDGPKLFQFFRSNYLQKESSRNSVNEDAHGSKSEKTAYWMNVGPTGFRWLLLILPLVIYCLVTGANPPVMRATLIVLVFVFCFVVGREKIVYHAFSFAALIILIFNPQALFGASFQLSFAACLGIIYISPKLIKVVSRKSEVVSSSEQTFANSILHYLRLTTHHLLTLFFVSTSAQLGTAPLLAKYFYKLSIVALISNLIVVPAVGIILWLCFGLFFAVLVNDFFVVLELIASNIFLGFISTCIMPTIKLGATAACFLVKLSVWLCYTSSHWLIKLVEFFASRPGAIVRTGEPCTVFIIIYYVLLIAIFKFKKVLYQLAGVALLVLLVVFSSLHITHHTLHITFLDVGLGDAIFIKSPSGENIFIDCGGNNLDAGRWVYEPFLWHQGIMSIDKIFITTNKWTHYSGLKTLIEKFKVKEIHHKDFCGSVAFTDESEFKQLIEIAKYKNTKLTRVKTDDIVFLDKSKKVKLEMFRVKRGISSNSENALPQESQCLISKLSYENISILFTSDASEETLNTLIDKHNIGEVTVVQYPAHGKQKISKETLQKLSPQYIIISTDNLPTKTFQLCNSISTKTNSAKYLSTSIIPPKIFSTSQNGAISIKSNGKTIKVIPFVPE